MSKRIRTSSHTPSYQTLEPRLCLTFSVASVGWDGPGLNEANLTYYIGDAPETIDQQTFRSVIQQSLSVWSEVVYVNFTETPFAGQRDSLDFTSGALDGRGGQMAEAYFPDDIAPPIIAGDVMFENVESWEVGNEQGRNAYDLMYVAVHEIGHALGLTHMDGTEPVMSPITLADMVFDGLSEMDVEGIQQLYKPRNDAVSDPTGGGFPDGNTDGGRGGFSPIMSGPNPFGNTGAPGISGPLSKLSTSDPNSGEDPNERFFSRYGSDSAIERRDASNLDSPNDDLTIVLDSFRTDWL